MNDVDENEYDGPDFSYLFDSPKTEADFRFAFGPCSRNLLKKIKLVVDTIYDIMSLQNDSWELYQVKLAMEHFTAEGLSSADVTQILQRLSNRVYLNAFPSNWKFTDNNEYISLQFEHGTPTLQNFFGLKKFLEEPIEDINSYWGFDDDKCFFIKTAHGKPKTADLSKMKVDGTDMYQLLFVLQKILKAKGTKEADNWFYASITVDEILQGLSDNFKTTKRNWSKKWLGTTKSNLKIHGIPHLIDKYIVFSDFRRSDKNYRFGIRLP